MKVYLGFNQINDKNQLFFRDGSGFDIQRKVCKFQSKFYNNYRQCIVFLS